ncbi:MAG: hypothetical protein RIK87_06940 [Fuerstiella sp.]
MSISPRTDGPPVEVGHRRLMEALDRTEALLQLEVQKHQLLLERLRRQQSGSKTPGPAVDYVIRPRRAA